MPTDRWSGVVEQVLERGVSAFLGTVEMQGRSAWVSAADRRLQLRCAVAPQDLHGARAGDWVIARITRHAGSASVRAGRDREAPGPRPAGGAGHRVGDRALRPAARVLRRPRCARRRPAASSVDPREAAARVDLRALPLVTIDGEDARDFDDAVYAEHHPAGFRLIVAIADVSHYVRPGTALDAEARAARHVGVLPDPRAADAADRAVRSPVLAGAARRPPVLRGRHGGQQERGAEERALLSGGDALGRAPDLHARARRRCSRAGPRRAPQLGPLAGAAAGAASRCTARCTRRAAGAARSTSTPPRPSSSSTRPSACAPSSCAPATTRTGSSRNA